MPNLAPLRECFKDLANDMFNIRNYPRYELPGQESIMRSITDSNIYECDLEDISLFLQKYLLEVSKLKADLSSIIDSQPPEDIYRPYPENYPSVRDPDPAKEIVFFLDGRLSYYETELKKVQTHVDEMQGELGSDRFAPAGFKLKLNLNNEEIAYFIKALVAEGILTTLKGDKPMQKDLATFINRNFASNTTNNIKEERFKNLLSEAKSLPESTSKLFLKLSRLTNI